MKQTNYVLITMYVSYACYAQCNTCVDVLYMFPMLYFMKYHFLVIKVRETALVNMRINFDLRWFQNLIMMFPSVKEYCCSNLVFI